MALSGLLLASMAASTVATATFSDMGDRHFEDGLVNSYEGYGVADRHDNFLGEHGLFDYVAYTDPDDDAVAALSVAQISVVPLPAATWLFGTALIGFVAMSRRRNVS